MKKLFASKKERDNFIKEIKEFAEAKKEFIEIDRLFKCNVCGCDCNCHPCEHS